MLVLKDDRGRIGDLFIREGLINKEQLERALAQQKTRKGYQPLGEICRNLGLITRRELREVLLKYRKQIVLGDLLLRLGVVSQSQLREALELQRTSGKKLGEILVEKGFLTEAALQDTLSIQLGVEKASPDSRRVDRALLNGVNAAFLRKKGVLPLFHDKATGVLTVVMENPTDAETIADLEKIFRMRVEPTILTSGAVDNLLNELFDVWFSSY
jgi:type IV pilus assembly protein PilB